MKTQINRILNNKNPNSRNNDYSTLTGGPTTGRSSSMWK